jgi:hypothetical protein
MRRSLSVSQLLQITVRLDDYRNVYIEGGRQAGGPLFRDNVLSVGSLFPVGCDRRGCEVRCSWELPLASASADTMACRRKSRPGRHPRRCGKCCYDHASFAVGSQARKCHIERAQADPHGEMGRLTIITALNGL